MIRVIGLMLVLCIGVLASGRVRADTASDCAALANLRIEDTNLLSATVVPAKDQLPEYCRVLGFVRPAINFELRLPTAQWNGKFFMAGCGGFCGQVLSDRPGNVNSVNYGLRRGYASATTDSGHWAAVVTDGRWGDHNRVAEADYGFRAVAETTRVSKALLREFYRSKEKRSYFNGCSNGGRQGLMAAQRYPEDFDGILAGAPSLDMTTLVTSFAWNVQANTGPDGNDILPRSKVGLIEKAVVQACDAKDGLEDGVIDDPRACDFKPATLRCQRGKSGAECLSDAEVTVLEKWYGGMHDSRGQRLYAGGIPYGSEPFWWMWLTGLDKTDKDYVRSRYVPQLAAGYFPHLAFMEDPGERFGPLQVNFDTDPEKLKPMGEIFNATNPDLSRFKARGGKLLMFHGWQDAIVTPERTVQYHREVEEHMGGRAATQEFMRLFMVPGLDHCGVLPGPGVSLPAGFDAFAALEKWVEEGVSPTQILSTKTDPDGKVIWTRPLCSYPQVAKYRGTGNVNDAASFSCVEPPREASARK